MLFIKHILCYLKIMYSKYIVHILCTEPENHVRYYAQLSVASKSYNIQCIMHILC